jgi:Bacterial Ig-like domain (group 4)
MDKKKVFKLATASTVAASAFVVSAPADAAGFTVAQAEYLVNKAIKAQDSLRKQSTVYNVNDPKLLAGAPVQINRLEKAIANAKAAIGTLSKKHRVVLYAKLDEYTHGPQKLTLARTLENGKNFDEAAHAAVKVQEAKAALEAKLEAKIYDETTDAAVVALEEALTEAKTAYGYVYGKFTREAFRATHGSVVETWLAEKKLEIEAEKAPVVKSVSALEDITVTQGDELELPASVEVTYSDDVTGELGVEWDVSELDLLTPGTYTLTGTVEGTELTASVKVIVEEALLEIAEVSAINATTVQATFPVDTEVTAADLAAKTVKLVSGDKEVVATYKADSFKDRKATFELSGTDKLVDAASYTVTSDWADFTGLSFVAKVAAPYVASFERVTTGITDSTAVGATATVVNVLAKNQYGEEIAVPATAELKITVNGMPLDTDEAEYSTGVVSIDAGLLKEGDTVKITLSTKDADGNVLAENTFEYTVLKDEGQVVSTLSVNPEKTSLPAKEGTKLNVKVRDQFNNLITTPLLRYVVNGNVVEVGGENSPLVLNETGEVVFLSNTPGQYQVQVFSTTNTKVSGSTTITVGAATLTDLATVETEGVVTAANQRFNNEELIVATVAPNEGAALLPENLKFNVSTTTPGLTAADVNVVAAKKTVGTGSEAKEVIVIKATSSKAGAFTVTPYVGESFTTETTVRGESVTFTTTVNPTVAGISNFSFDTKALKTGASDVKAEVVFTNKHGEVLTANQVNGNSIAQYTSSNDNVTGAVTVVQGSGDNAGKTYVNLADLGKGTALVTVQVGSLLKSVQVNVADPVLTTVNAGADVTGVVAGDSITASLAKYNEVKFLDQDSEAIDVTDATITVRKSGATMDLAAEEAAKLVEIGTAVKNESGNIIGLAEASTSLNAIKIHPAADVAEGNYTVTVSKVIGEVTVSDSFSVTVGAARQLTSIAATPSTASAVVGAKTQFVLSAKDQYNAVVDINESGAEANVKLVPQNGLSISDVAVSGDNNVSFKLAASSAGTYSAVIYIDADGDNTKDVDEKFTSITFKVSEIGNAIASLEVQNTATVNPGTVDGDDVSDYVVDLASSSVQGTKGGDTTVALSTKAKDASGDEVSYSAGQVLYSVKTHTLKNVDGSAFGGTVSVDASGVVTIADTSTAEDFEGTVTIKATSLNGVVTEKTFEVTSVGEIEQYYFSSTNDGLDENNEVLAPLSTITLDESADHTTDGLRLVHVVGVNEFGRLIDVDENSFVALNIDNSSLASVAKNSGIEFTATATGSSTFRAFITAGSSIATSIEVKANAVEAAELAAIEAEVETFTSGNSAVLAKSVDTVEVGDKDAVESALLDYDSLSPAAQAELDTEKTLLDSLLVKIGEKEAEAALQTINDNALDLSAVELAVFTTAGITGVTSENLTDVKAALQANSDDAPWTLEEIQNIVNGF